MKNGTVRHPAWDAVYKAYPNLQRVERWSPGKISPQPGIILWDWEVLGTMVTAGFAAYLRAASPDEMANGYLPEFPPMYLRKEELEMQQAAIEIRQSGYAGYARRRPRRRLVAV